MTMEIQPQWEEFIIAVFKMSRRQGKATNKELSQRLSVSPSLVTEIIKKMQAEGILAAGKNIIALTEAGEDIAKRIISKHRLWEYFLTETLNYNWKDVHEQASALQSVTSDALFEKLNDYLRRPAACPHGGAIFANRAEELEGLVPLSEGVPGVSYTMRRIPDNTALLEYVEHIGLSLGQALIVKGFESFDHTAIIDMNGAEVRVSPKACVDIYLAANTED
ncbi:metal-dependent transcriptional regulator [Selenomonas sp. F0473]|uniref:metal-dependent transcriptional regulator n=1 Tax=Selenomonas sp. F0473 TaxID=999423 RepID=UPI0025E189A2|nr:metal-dependent transcriptional regulator [Selenomonas sp. F0473]